MLNFKVMLLLMDYAATITIDNDIIGDPDIECLDEQIRIFVKTRKIFNGYNFNLRAQKDTNTFLRFCVAFSVWC